MELSDALEDDDNIVVVADFLQQAGFASQDIVNMVGHLVLTRFALPIEEIVAGIQELGFMLPEQPATFES